MTTYKVEYEVTIDTLEHVWSTSAVFEGLTVVPELGGLTRHQFDEDWEGAVVRAAIDRLPIHESLEGAHMYLGRYKGDMSPVVVLGNEMDDYGDEIVYNAWRVTVTAHEANWGLA